MTLDFDIQNTHLFQLILADSYLTFNHRFFYTIAGKMDFLVVEFLGQMPVATLEI